MQALKIFRKKDRGGAITRAEAMHCIPLKNLQVREEHREGGLVLLCYPLEMRPWLSRWMRRLGAAPSEGGTRKLQLDELGTAVWDLLDGQRSVGQVIQDFAALHRLHPREAEVSVTRFLWELGKRGLIGLQ